MEQMVRVGAPAGAHPLFLSAAALLFAAAASSLRADPPPDHSGSSRVVPILRSTSASDPDTVWIGHVVGTTGLPGTPGGYGPYHIGRGGNRQITQLPASAANNGYWDFDRFSAGENDSLQGWWPVAAPYQNAGSASSDVDR